MVRRMVFVFLAIGLSACSALPSTSGPGFTPTTHVVAEGETLASIAEQYGLEPRTILQSNYSALMDDPTNIKLGLELRIGPADGVLYRWNEGDRLASVADFFGVEMSAIVEFEGNKLDSLPLTAAEQPEIPPGTLLFIPGGERPLIRPPTAEQRTVEDCSLWYPTLPARCMVSKNGSSE